MSQPIGRLFAFIVVLFALLIAWTSRWTVFEAPKLRNNVLNVRPLIEQLKIRRGTITAADGTVLARSVPAVDKTWSRVYPQGALFAQPIGYSIVSQNRRAGLERSRNDVLTGTGNELGSILDELQGKQRVGDNVTTTLSTKATRVAEQALGGQNGSVVALDPRTGAVKVMYSVPSYDPNHPSSGGAQLNRATQAQYPPGSTFKVVTAAAAIDSGRYTPSSTINGNSPVTISGVPLANDDHKSYGPIDLTTALTFSVNTVFAQLGEALGRPTMATYMKRFGFYSTPPLDYPPDEISRSGERTNGRLLAPASGAIDVGRMAIGQDKLTVTPLQMAMVAAAVANGGVLMKPHITQRVVDQDGRTVENVKPSVLHRVMKSSTAAELATMMEQVVNEGTGTASALSGIRVAGKTGTAQINIAQNITQPWFIAFAPIDHPTVAIAVTVERSNGGFGGTVAAPIAKQVMEALLH